MLRLSFLAAIAVAACSPSQPAPVRQQAAATPTDLKALEAAHDWQNEPGDGLNIAWNAGVKAILGKLSRAAAIEAVKGAGFECLYGEAHETYPDPMAVCTRSFATRACQIEWEISTTADKGMVDEVDGSIRRDCVGLENDWPDKVKSAIDDQLAQPTPQGVPPH